MIRIFTFISVLLICAVSVSAQESPAPTYFIAFYTTGPAWDAGGPAHEQKYFSEHSGYL